MPDAPASLQTGDVFNGFRVNALLSCDNTISVYRAHDERVDRAVLLRVAGEADGALLLADARRIAALSHPGLVEVLAAGESTAGAYAVIPDLHTQTLADAGPLTSSEGARVAVDVAGAIEALALAGVRVPIDATTVTVSRIGDGVRGVLDPLRATGSGRSCLAASDADASTMELVDLIDGTVTEPTPELSRAFAEARKRSGVDTGPSHLAALLAPAAGPPAKDEHRRRVGRAVALVIAGLVVVAVAASVVHTHSGGSSKPAAHPRVAAARIIARIPLGLTGKNVAFSPVIVGREVWLGTSANSLIHVDPATNQVVGDPVELGRQHPLTQLAASTTSLYTTDYAGWLLRIDPKTRRIVMRRKFSPHLTAVAVTGDDVWIAIDDGPNSTVRRVDAATLRPTGRALGSIPGVFRLDVHESDVWVVGGAGTGEVARIDAGSGRRTLAYVGPQPTSSALTADALWLTDRFDGTVSALDARRVAFTRPAVKARRAARGIVSDGRDIWFTALSELDSGDLRLERMDPLSQRLVGRSVSLGTTIDFGEAAGLGSVWVVSAKSLIRLAPTTPRPALAAPPPPSHAPRALVSGPLQAGTWRDAVFALPLTFSTPSFKWLAIYPLPDSVALLSTGSRQAELDISAPGQLFGADDKLRALGRPAHVLAVLRGNAHLTVGAVHRASVDGRPALQFELRARKPVAHPEVCGPVPCTLLFPIVNGTVALSEGDVARWSVFRVGQRTVIASEGGTGNDRAARAATASLLATVRFDR